MEIITIILLGLVIIAVVYLIITRNAKPPEDTTSSQLMMQQLNELIRRQDDLKESVNTKLHESSKGLYESLKHQSSESIKIIRDVTERLTQLDETNKQVVSFTDQLQSLQDILKNPKQRGILGEYYLETLLKNTLPPGSFEMQYAMGKDENGNDLIPDAIVRVKDKLIPIDSKFSLENYNRISETSDLKEKERLEKIFVNDLKNRITETAKYIQPAKGTMEFAFMFIPHEAIYYDLLTNTVGALRDEEESLIQRAASKYKVIIVSPTSFLAYLQTVLQGLKALQIEEQAVHIIKRVGELGKHMQTYETYHAKMGNALGTVVNHWNASAKELKKVDKDVLRITGEAINIEPLLLDKPDSEE